MLRYRFGLTRQPSVSMMLLYFECRVQNGLSWTGIEFFLRHIKKFNLPCGLKITQRVSLSLNRKELYYKNTFLNIYTYLGAKTARSYWIYITFSVQAIHIVLRTSSHLIQGFNKYCIVPKALAIGVYIWIEKLKWKFWCCVAGKVGEILCIKIYVEAMHRIVFSQYF